MVQQPPPRRARRRTPARLLVAGLLAVAGSAAVVTGTAGPAWACHGLVYGNPVRSTSGFTFEVTSSFATAGNITALANNGTASLSGTSWATGDTPVTATVTGLNPGQSATVQFNAALAGGGTACSSYTNSAQNAPAETPAFSAVTRTATGFTFTITNYDGDVYDYTFAETNDATATDDGDGLITVTGLSEGASSAVTVTATAKSNSGFDGDASATVTGAATVSASTPPTPPAPPSSPAKPAAAAGDSAVKITWVRPEANGSTVTGYLVTAAPGGATCSGGATATSCLIGGLDNGTPYRFSVVALSDLGRSPVSPLSDAATPASTTNKGIDLDRPRTVPGDRVQLHAEVYDPGARVTFTLYSTPTVLGTAIAGADGVATLRVDLPPGVTGEHVIRALGIGANGLPLSQDTDITITAPGEGGGGLPVTGPGAGVLVGVAVALLLGGAALTVAARRRRIAA
ncbi:fibronectin type III domain-containing protein [Actinoplanes sp. NPDC051470]|uniref:fibronectin type III domain-containing protein n=1 Tax=Actinoplanes sp. NPDC051470 TaxID=3157224 RepID=UPI00342B7EFB